MFNGYDALNALSKVMDVQAEGGQTLQMPFLIFTKSSNMDANDRKDSSALKVPYKWS